jgi:hypothetical protein
MGLWLHVIALVPPYVPLENFSTNVYNKQQRFCIKCCGNSASFPPHLGHPHETTADGRYLAHRHVSRCL